MGLRFGLGRNVFGQIYFAEALRDVDTPEDRDLQDSGIQFSLGFSY